MNIRHIKDSWIPKKLGVTAITIFPFIFYAESKPSYETQAHEMIHIEQVRKIGWIRFYLSYLLFYIAFRLMTFDHKDSHDKSYYSIPYEAEAYHNHNEEPRG
jgi:hypothetical protein